MEKLLSMLYRRRENSKTQTGDESQAKNGGDKLTYKHRCRRQDKELQRAHADTETAGKRTWECGGTHVDEKMCSFDVYNEIPPRQESLTLILVVAAP